MAQNGDLYRLFSHRGEHLRHAERDRTPASGASPRVRRLAIGRGTLHRLGKLGALRKAFGRTAVHFPKVGYAQNYVALRREGACRAPG